MNLDALGPVETVEFIHEPLRVCSDAKHPLAHRATLNGMSADFAFSINDLLIRKHSAEFRAPVHWRGGDIGETDTIRGVAFICGDWLGAIRRRVEPRIIELEKNPLRPFEIAGIRCVYLALPVVAEADALKLRAEIGYVRLGGHARVLAGLDGVLLGGKTEGVPAHRVQHVEATHFFVAPDDVRRRVALGMPHVQARTARVGKHIEHVVFWPRSIEAGLARIRSVKGRTLGPHALPAGLKLFKRKWTATFVAHGERARNVAGTDAGCKLQDARAACVRRWGLGNLRTCADCSSPQRTLTKLRKSAPCSGRIGK